jgi:tetratricopeptide (TPR) repeat protein
VAVVIFTGLADAAEALRTVLAHFDPQRRSPEATDVAGLAAAAHRLLDGKDALIVLDNVEPALKIEQVVAPLRATGVTLLLTAREALSSAVPADASRRLELLVEHDVVDLFAAYYGRNAALDLTLSERTVVERIVETLGRHTLAVKLAGAYAQQQHLALETLARELRDPQRAIELPDQETPGAVALVFASSYQALPAAAQRLFAALGAFATLESGRQAATAVGEALQLANPAHQLDVLVLRALADPLSNASLLEGSDQQRLRLHPLMRTFAANEFAKWGHDEQAEAHRAIAHFCVEYADAVDYLALGPDEANIEGALEWAHAHGEDELVAALTDGMRQHLYLTDRTREGLRYLPWGIDPWGIDAAERQAAETNDRQDRLVVLALSLMYARMLQTLDRLNEAEAAFQRNLALRRELGDRTGEGELLTDLGQIAQRRGRLEEAEQYYQQALAIAREVQDRQGKGLMFSNLGGIARQRGRLEEDEQYFEQSLLIRREVQDRGDEGMVLSNLGSIAHARGRLEETERYSQESLAIRREVQDRRGKGVVLFKLALIAEAQGDLQRAEVLHRESLAIGNALQNGQDIADSHAYLGEFLITKRFKREEGCQMLAEAARIYEQMRVPGVERVRETAQRLGCPE